MAAEVELIECMGTDLTVVNAARVSFGTRKSTLDDADVRLLNYLAREQHFSPFRHCHMMLRLKVPEFVARQLYKHVVGIESTSVHPTKDHAWSEVSGRYKVLRQVYLPSVLHTQHPTAKQCASGPLEDTMNQTCLHQMRVHYEQTWNLYENLMASGVAKEEARQILPLSFMTEVIWTASLQAIHHAIRLRQDPHAQTEIRELARLLEIEVQRVFPQAYAALSKAL